MSALSKRFSPVCRQCRLATEGSWLEMRLMGLEQHSVMYKGKLTEWHSDICPIRHSRCKEHSFLCSVVWRSILYLLLSQNQRSWGFFFLFEEANSYLKNLMVDLKSQILENHSAMHACLLLRPTEEMREDGPWYPISGLGCTCLLCSVDARKAILRVQCLWMWSCHFLCSHCWRELWWEVRVLTLTICCPQSILPWSAYK